LVVEKYNSNLYVVYFYFISFFILDSSICSDLILISGVIAILLPWCTQYRYLSHRN